MDMTNKVARPVLAAVLSSLLGGISVFAATPASASAQSALDACRSNAPAPITQPLSIVNSQWDAFYGYPDQIWPGDVIRVTASGSIKIGSWPWDPSYGPKGSNDWPDSVYYPAQNQHRYSLAGLWSNSITYFPVGTDSGCIAYNGSQKVYLTLTQNDAYPIDNSGTWSIQVRHYWS
jgi:hypothetical protein